MLQEVKKMGFSTNWITLLLVSACTLVVHGQENAQTRIPDSLIECYRNQSLRNPENRPPMNIWTFIDLVRKVEDYQKGTVDMAELTTSILHRFRLDGIERSPGVVESDGVLPYAVTGFPFFKHRLILKYLVPSNNYQFPNESLSQVELCTLHFMLSHTIETTQRGDESTVCGKLSNYESRNRAPRSARIKRQAADVSEQVGTAEPNPNLSDVEEIPAGDKGKEFQVSAENSENTSKNVPKDTDGSDATQTQGEKAANQTASGNETKSGKYIFDDETPFHSTQQQKARNVVDPKTDTNVQSRVTVTTIESDCPLESGAVYTDWGTVSLGAVIAGIAAGLYQQDVPVADLVRKTPPLVKLPTDLEGTGVDNRFAVTLVGDLCEAALMEGPKSPDNIKIGLTGGWNSTLLPRWYFEKERDSRQLTDAEIRGGLDGLVLGTHIREWKGSLTDGDLLLSQVLSMYYSEDGVFGSQYRACQRRDLYSEVAPNNKMQEQAYRFAVVLDQHSLGRASVDAARIKDFAEAAVTQLTTYLPGMKENACSSRQITPRQTNLQNLPLYTNVTVVIDKSWPFADIKGLIYVLAQELGLSNYGSRLTVLDGQNGAAFITDAMYSVDVDRNFTLSEFNKHEAGMDIPQALEQVLEKSMKGLLQAESEQTLGGGRSTVVLFIPYQAVSLTNNDLEIVKNKINDFRDYLPDVRFLYLAPGNKDNYKELVDNPNTDVITFTSLTEDSEKINFIRQVTDRIKQVPLRLFNPTCGSEWISQSYVSADFEYSVKQTGVKYHQLHPNYFFGTGSAEITVVGSSQDLTVCYSRKSLSSDNTTSDVTCLNTQNGEVKIPLQNPCEGIEHISQCRPLYISVKPSTATYGTTSCTECDNPMNAQYTIRNQGLGCWAGVGHLLSNPQVILLTSVILLMKYLTVGS